MVSFNQTYQPGDWVGGYVLQQQLGRGGAGVVWEATDEGGNSFALKIIHPAIAADPAARARLQREANTVNRIRDPGVARVVDLETEGPTAFVVTELVDGISLREHLARRGPLTYEAAIKAAVSLYGTLRRVHAAGVIHRDLKPSNIILGPYAPVLIDFGIAQSDGDERLTSTGLVSGTPGWVETEVLAGATPDAISDWWAWAGIVLTMLTGRPPFGTGSFSTVVTRQHLNQADVRGVPPVLARKLRAALGPREDRPTPEDILLALENRPSEDGDGEATTVLDASSMPTPLPEATLHTPAAPTQLLDVGGGDVAGEAPKVPTPVADPTVFTPVVDSTAVDSSLLAPGTTTYLDVTDATRTMPTAPGHTAQVPTPAGRDSVLQPQPSGNYYPADPYYGSPPPNYPVDYEVEPAYPMAPPYVFQTVRGATAVSLFAAAAISILPLWWGTYGAVTALLAAVVAMAWGYARQWRERRRTQRAGKSGSDGFLAGLRFLPGLLQSALALTVSVGAATLVTIGLWSLLQVNISGRITPNPWLDVLVSQPGQYALHNWAQMAASVGLQPGIFALAMWASAIFALLVMRVGPGGWQLSQGTRSLLGTILPWRWLRVGFAAACAGAVLFFFAMTAV